MDIANRLKLLRKQKKETQKLTAESAGITERAYQYYENNQQKPNVDTLVALADHFDTSADFILGRTDNPSPPPK